VHRRAHTRHGSDRCRTFFSVAEPKKEKTEQSANGAISPSGAGEAANLGSATTGPAASVPDHGDQQKPNRPNTLDARVVARRLILFDSEYRAALATHVCVVAAQRKLAPISVRKRVRSLVDNRNANSRRNIHAVRRCLGLDAWLGGGGRGGVEGRDDRI